MHLSLEFILSRLNSIIQTVDENPVNEYQQLRLLNCYQVLLLEELQG